MKFRLGQIQDMKEALGRLTNEQLPLKIAFKLNKLVRDMDVNLTAIEEERIKLVKKLGEENDKTGSIEIPKDKIPQFQEEFVELMSEEVEIDFTPFSVDDFANAKLTTQDMLKLALLFEE
jgi:hypothetical protein